MKTLKLVVNWVIWGVVVLNVGIMTFTHIPACQEWLGQQVSMAISKKLGTEASVGRVDMGFLNRLIVDDICIKDQHQHPLLRVGRISVRVDLLPLLSDGRIVISSAQLFNAQAKLYRPTLESPTNFQFVIDSLTSKDTTNQSPINLAVNSLIVRRSSVSYDVGNVPKTTDKINQNHLKINDISAHVLLKHLSEDSLSLNVKRLALKEQSGLVLSRLSFALERHHQQAQLTNFFLQLPRSSISIEQIKAIFDPDRISETLNYEGEVNDANITPTDLKFLIPETSWYKTPISLKTVFRGSANGIDISMLKLQSADGNLAVNAAGWIHQWDKTPVWHINLPHLHISNELFENLRQHNSSMPAVLFRIGDLSMTGDAQGHEDGTINMNCQLAAGIGQVKMNGSMMGNRSYAGHIDTEGLHFGKLLDDESFGVLAATVEISGHEKEFKTRGQVPHLEYNDYTYHNITLDGSYNNGDVSGKLQVDDPNLSTSITGEFKNQKPLGLKLTGNIAKLIPKKLNLSDKWGNASFGASINADFTANTLNDAMGNIVINDFTMTDSTLIYQVDHLQIKSGYDEGIHYMRLDGDMGTAELKGQFDWATLPQSITNHIASRLPTLPGLPHDTKATSNDFDIDLRFTDTDWLRHLLGIDLKLAEPMQLNVNVNDASKKINVRGMMPSFWLNDSQYAGGRLDISSPSDTIHCNLAATRLTDKNHKMDFGIRLIAANNNLSASLTWDNHRKEKTMRGQLNASATFYNNDKGISEARTTILPSHVTMGEAEWNIEPGEIIYNAERLSIDHLAMSHDLQHIIIEGAASDSDKDSLIVDLKDVEVAYILDLVNFTSVSFSGQATGKAHVIQASSDPKAWANLRVKHFEFEGGRMGVLDASAQWNAEKKQIDIRGICDDGPDAKTYVEGYVSPTNDNIDLLIQGRGTYIDFLQTYSNSFLSNVTGNAFGDLRLVGPLGEMDLLGELIVSGKSTVTALGTTYTLNNDTVHFVVNDILLNNVIASDRYGNKATLNGGIHHDHLSNLTFDLDVMTDKLLAYDLKETTDELFYGTVFASGEIGLQGRPGEVLINCNATPLEGTVFTYNAANPDAISDQRFIKWHDASLRHAMADPTNEDLPTVYSDIPSDLRINFLLNVSPDATLRLLMDAKTSDYITLGGNGVIRATYYNKGAFQMFGTYTVEKGTYGITIQNIIKKNFTFQPGGTIVFGGNPFDANLNLQALYTVNGVSLSDLSIGNTFSSNTVRVNCLMNILGQAGAPRVEFDLEMPTVNSEENQMIRSVIASEQEMNQQVLYLLGIGRFYTQGANNANTQQQYGQSQLAMQSFLSGTLTTQLNEVLSQVLKSNNWNFGANISTGNEGWHNAEYEGVVSGRMLNNRLLINGQFGYRDNATQATPSFIGDFDIRYLLQPNGNLALKMYNQTNDRYFTHSSLNTQGIGLIIKKDFNGLRDLFHRRKRHQ